MSERVDIGNLGEDSACEFLSQKGFVVLERNWRFGSLEVDIIALKDDILHIVEVKTRSADYIVSPLAAVTIKKQKNLIDAANAYLRLKKRTEEIVFDIVSVLMSCGNIIKIEHIESAFFPKVR